MEIEFEIRRSASRIHGPSSYTIVPLGLGTLGVTVDPLNLNRASHFGLLKTSSNEIRKLYVLQLGD